MMIYLVSNTPYNLDEVINLKVCEIVFYKFNLNLNDFDAVVFTSKNGVNALKFNNIKCENLDTFAISDSTAQACKEFGFKRIFEGFYAHGNEFAKEIFPLLKGKKVLYVSAKDTVSGLSSFLQSNGVDINSLIAYENRLLKLNLKKPENGSTIIFTSPKNVEGFLSNFGWNDSYKAIAIGKTTAKALNFVTKAIISPTQQISECVNVAKSHKI
ncbi:uroporphyrinogen-III synthase [Campylobacter fetus]|uniref:uroporphyrinogen-III synthase n=1 Tax=Campylobacter fetus TaxID=196 RepID=UPI001F2EEFD4|nr:uroporphyrinogen-III synthase [Campylobacter fetus]